MFIRTVNKLDPRHPLHIIADESTGEILEVLPGTCGKDAMTARLKHLRLRRELDIRIITCASVAEAEAWLERQRMKRDGELCGCSYKDFNHGPLCPECGRALT